MPTPTHEKIASYTVTGSTTANIILSSIPQTYSDLKLVLSLRNNVAVTSSNVLLYFNNDTTGSNYSNLFGQANGSSVGTGIVAAMINDVPGTSITSGYFGNTEVYIFDYANTSFYKHFQSRSSNDYNNTTSYMMNTVNRWQSSAAINSIRLENRTSGSFTQHSTVTLYGIKNS